VCGSNGGSCPVSCTQDTQCVAGDVCAGGACGPMLAQGAPCVAANQCLSGFCVDGVCCGSACGSTCQACSAAKTGGANGTCADVKDGTDPKAQCPADTLSCTAAVCVTGACT